MISQKELEDKRTGDGAFAKGNSPFKNKMDELFGKHLFRWDILHMINRAPVEAKGKINFKKNTSISSDSSEDEDSD